MLRIDETSKTLVAPPAGGLVTEVNPDREEMLALVSSSWEAFAGELGQPSLRFVGQGQVARPRPARLRRAGRSRRRRRRLLRRRRRPADDALSAAAAVAGMDAASLAAVHDSLQAAVPGDSPQVVLVAGSFDAARSPRSTG